MALSKMLLHGLMSRPVVKLIPRRLLHVITSYDPVILRKPLVVTPGFCCPTTRPLINDFSVKKFSSNNAQENGLPAEDVCDLSTEYFRDIVKNVVFIDKTLFIEEFFKTKRIVLITAPRRFGKSTVMNMLKEFVMIQVQKDGEPIPNAEDGENYKFFQQFKLYKEYPNFFKQHCGKYPVIACSFKGVGGTSIKEVRLSIKIAVRKAFAEHSYLIRCNGDNEKWVWASKKLHKSAISVHNFVQYYDEMECDKLNEVDVINGLEVLSKILHIHYDRKVIALIDEFDAPIMQAIHDGMSKKVMKDMNTIMCRLVSEFLKGNPHVKKGLINACVKLAGVFSWDANNIIHHPFLRGAMLANHYGFTSVEVSEIFAKPEVKKLKLFDKLVVDEVARWYDGYKSCQDETISIYNSWSILNFLSNSVFAGKPMFDSYWVDSGCISILQRFFSYPEVRSAIQKLLDDQEIDIELVKASREDFFNLQRLIGLRVTVLNPQQVNLLLQFLYENGYLTAIKLVQGKVASLGIPNFEIKAEFLAKFYNLSIFEERYQLDPDNMQAVVEAFQSILSEPEEHSFVALANSVTLLFSGEARLPKNEFEFHSIISVLAYNCRELKAESALPVSGARKSEKGRFPELDMFIQMGSAAAIIEKKVDPHSASDGYKQIKQKGYYKLFDEEQFGHVKTKVYVGMHLSKNKRVTVCYSVNTLENPMEVCDTVTAKIE